ncbi:uncharacterized protein LOC125568349 [Nematostella vectensis]|uniref:uncharacterized protein LOC125563019 n=1 Tax=Nematostella vectensis TaxID=45351 RepID=UPI0020772C87|nr:uncharacterized protein LOC125563019 [Nematostella vectensis]XP_048583558.1 uncharacterized protein LOC125563020 [Nematostella vectensis]XP_048586372.1 uncharacterized protein LOC125568349 [Nematostella vectensis]
MKVTWIRHVNLHDAWVTSPLLQLLVRHPSEPVSGQRFTHRPAVQVVCIQGCIPSQSGCCVVPGWVQAIVLETDISKVLENVCQQEHVRLKIEIVVIPHGAHLEGFPHFLRVLVIFLRYVRIVESRVKRFFRRKLDSV